MFCYNPFGYASGIVTTLGNEFSEICNKYSEQRGGGGAWEWGGGNLLLGLHTDKRICLSLERAASLSLVPKQRMLRAVVSSQS